METGWSLTRPDAPGEYLWRKKEGDFERVVQIIEFDDELVAINVEFDRVVILSHVWGEWSIL